YFQTFTIPGAVLDGPARLLLKSPMGEEIELKAGTDSQPFGMAGSGKLSGPVAFAGYGITGTKETNYDDFQALDATGKVLIVLRDAPRADTKDPKTVFEGSRRRQFASFTEKLANAEKHKAAAIL